MVGGSVGDKCGMSPFEYKPESAQRDEPPWRVLLADDEPVQRMLVGRMLTRAGYEVEIVEDGAQALQRLAQGDIQLVVTDWEMPNVDGLGMCRSLRSMQLDRYVYVIVVTSRDAVEHVVMGLQAGADDYLVKPVLEPELLARLNTGKRLVAMERSLRAANAENRRLSITDPLTGVYNRRYLMTNLLTELSRAQRYRHPLSLLLCDVDHFKRINDTYGHQAGDEVLIGFARTLSNNLRDTDWVARYGGEEFVIVLPETSVENAQRVAERCRMAVSTEEVMTSQGAIRITASFGVTAWSADLDDHAQLDALIAAADAGVYASKAAGRNQVTVRLLAAA